MITTPYPSDANLMRESEFLFTASGYNLYAELDRYMNEPGHYVHKGPDFFGMMRHVFPHEMAGAPGEFWFVFYAAVRQPCTIISLSRFIPYSLPYIAFARGVKGNFDLKYYKTERITRLCKTLASCGGG